MKTAAGINGLYVNLKVITFTLKCETGKRLKF